MANISTITYNGKVISEAEEAGNVAVQYEGRTLATLSAGQTKTFLCNGKVMKTNLYIGAKTLLCAMNQMIADVVVAVKSSFPAAPTAYSLIKTFTSSQTWTAPEDGWFQVEVYGASGAGGNWAHKLNTSKWVRHIGCGGGGGGGGYACSRIKMKKGDTISLVPAAVSATSSATVNSSVESYSALSVTSGATGGNGTANSSTQSGGAGGKGGIASGGNYINADGKTGGVGGSGSADSDKKLEPAGGVGGTAGYTGGNTGGVGARYWYMDSTTGEVAAGAGSKGFIKIYRGNTNDINGGAISSVLDNNSWSNISKIAKEGKASQYWSVGDTKTFDIGGTIITAQIIGFNHDDVTDATSYGRAKAGITFQLKDIYAKQCWTIGNVGETAWRETWETSQMRTVHLPSYFALLDAELRKVIVPVNKLTAGTISTYPANVSLSENLFLLSEPEILGTNAYSNARSSTPEGSRYAFYSAGNSSIKYLSGTATKYWTRSTYCLYKGSDNPICKGEYRVSITATGTAGHDKGYIDYGVAFAFCV